MISANLTNAQRKEVYRRDGYRCAICDDNRHLQIHHYVHRSLGGNDTPHNLITLCQRCHALAHGTRFPELPKWLEQTDIEQAIVEYLEDYYTDEWYPYK